MSSLVAVAVLALASPIATIGLGGIGAGITVERHALPDPIREARQTTREGRPALRGWRAPILAQAGEQRPMEPPTAGREDPRTKAFELVQSRLARDGLLATLAAAIEALGPAAFASGGDLDRLAEVGLPVDWLAYFAGPDGEPIVPWIARALVRGASANDLSAELARCRFAFQPTRAGYRVASESGEHAVGALRLQITSPDYYAGRGDGGALDLTRQLAELLPDADVFASIEEKHLAGFLATAQSWDLDRAGRFVVLPGPLPLAQWAQDNGKPGLAPRSSQAGGGAIEALTLVPRYASRGEDGARFVPGETFAIDAFAAAGNEVAQSPLFFQGGNLLAVRDPKTGARTLLVGEAEVHRNVSLGLSREQVLEAFATELGVERCLVLPAISFHIDFEVSVRAVGDELVACVNDSPAAVAILLECGLDALVAQDALEPDGARAARAAIRSGRSDEAAAVIGPSVMRRALGYGHFPESFARHFARGPADSGVGNLQRFLLAVDLSVSATADLDAPAIDPRLAAYLRTFVRRESERGELARTLAAAGMRVVRVPSLSDDDRGINYLNGVHAPGVYLMPAYGGLYEPLDQAARRALEQAWGKDVEVVPVMCGETQRRGGGLHCAVSVIPRG